MNLETIQIVIIAALSISTVLITIIGIQIIFLIRDVHRVVNRTNVITTGLMHMTSVLERSLAEMTNLAGGAKFVIGLVTKLIGEKGKHGKK